MANRKFAMYQYRQIIFQMRQGESDRQIAQSGLAGRSKCQSIRALAKQHGWLEPTKALPDDKTLSKVLAAPKRTSVCASSVLPYKEVVLDWHSQGINSKTIYHGLVNRYDYSGSYDSVYRFIKKHAPSSVKATVPLHFEPAQAAQVDFGKGPKIVDSDTGEIINSWFFVMTLCFSRHMYVELVRDQTVETWLVCLPRSLLIMPNVPSPKPVVMNRQFSVLMPNMHKVMALSSQLARLGSRK